MMTERSISPPFSRNGDDVALATFLPPLKTGMQAAAHQWED